MGILKNIKFQYFPADVINLRPLGVVTLQQFIDIQSNPTVELQKTFEKIRSFPNNKAMRDYIKKNELFFFTPSVVLDPLGRRSYEDIKYFNPIAVIEFDGITLNYAKYLKKSIFYKYSFCIASYISPSGNGVKTLHRIPIATSIDEYKEYWMGLAYIFQDIQGFDISNQNCVLPLFVSIDESMLFRTNPTEISQKGYKENSFEIVPLEDRVVGEGITEDESTHAYNRVRLMFKGITDNGHPQVLRFSLVAGGYAGYGYGTEEVWIKILEEIIKDNEYLSSGGSIKTENYIRTAYNFYQKGKASPIPLHDNKTEKL